MKDYDYVTVMRPGPEEVRQRRVAVEGGGGLHLRHRAARLLDGAGPADVALHLDIAVGQRAGVRTAAEDVPRRGAFT